jgi:hydroxypyruvate isomerase
VPDDPLRYAVNCSILFTELPLAERPAAARAAGFRAIELWWPWPDAVPDPADVDALADAITSAGVRLLACNSYAGDMPAGERGIAAHAGRTAEFRANVEVLARFLARLDTRLCNVLYGNRQPGVSDAEHRATAVANLAHAAGVLARIGATVLVEPVSGIAGYPLRTAADALSVVDEVRALGHENTAFLFDTFHLAANGDDPLTALAAAGDRTGHVQLADFPGRGAPGTGALDFPAVLDALRRARGESWVSLEHSPDGDRGTAAALAWLPVAARERSIGA